MKREQINFSSELLKKAYDETSDVFQTNEFMVDQVYEIQNIGNIKTEVSNQDIALELSDRIKIAAQSQGITGVRTGFKEQDKLFSGWQKGNLIVLAARPGMGKTAKALCDVLFMVLNGKRVILFSLEMSAVELFQRLASMYMGIDADKFKTGRFTDEDWKTYNQKIQHLIDDNLIIVDDCYHMDEIRNRTKKERMKKEIDCVYVDYLQIAEGKGRSREQEISYISRSLKRLAKDIDAPVVALSQLSRKVDERGDKRPKLSDLRESGAIEQDADVVTFLYRPQYYDPDADNSSYLCVAKNRHGQLVDIKLKYIHSRTKFIDFDADEDGLPF